MEGVTRFLEKRLKLRINPEKSDVAQAYERDFLSFRILGGKKTKRAISRKAKERFRRRVKEITRRGRGVSLERVISELNVYLRGWTGYFGFCQTPSVLQDLDKWIRRRLRCFIWKRWKGGRTRYAELRRRGLGNSLAAFAAGSPFSHWRMSASVGLNTAFPNAFFSDLGLISMEARCSA
jgi:RNA-directed DNA polymerase